MATELTHELQDRYSKLVDERIREEIVTKTGIVFNDRHEGNPKAGAVKIPFRGEVEVVDYDKAKGVDLKQGGTAYKTLLIEHDIAVNELIDGFDAVAVPDNIVADRLESGAYVLANTVDNISVECLVDGGTQKQGAVITEETAFKEVMDARTELSVNNIPLKDRFMLVSPEFMAMIMLDKNFVKQGDLSQELVMKGVVGQIAGFNVIECSKLGADVIFVCGHPNYCTRVEEWGVPVHVQDLGGSGRYIGASAVQGRKLLGCMVTEQKAVIVRTVGK